MNNLLVNQAKIQQDFRCHIFAKAKNGKYLYCNDDMLKDIGFSDLNDMLDLTDFDFQFLDPIESKSLRANDLMVMTAGKPNILIERVTLANKNKSIAISYKEPLYKKDKIIGVCGASIIVSKEEFVSQAFFLINQPNSGQASFSLEVLTLREKECFYLLTRGLTAKQIANKINLSVRTVESYIDKIKKKLNCQSKAELIDKALTMIVIK